MRLNRFEDHKPEDIEFMLNLMRARVKVINDNVIKVRGNDCKELLDTCGFCFG